MDSKIICKSCNSEIGNIIDLRFIFKNMKSLSMIEMNVDGSKDIKCRCGQWNSFDVNGIQTINYKKKASEHLNFVR
jgi:hypothetical protein